LIRKQRQKRSYSVIVPCAVASLSDKEELIQKTLKFMEQNVKIDKYVE